jgi:hypothetical protein
LPARKYRFIGLSEAQSAKMELSALPLRGHPEGRSARGRSHRDCLYVRHPTNADLGLDRDLGPDEQFPRGAYILAGEGTRNALIMVRLGRTGGCHSGADKPLPAALPDPPRATSVMFRMGSRLPRQPGDDAAETRCDQSPQPAYPACRASTLAAFRRRAWRPAAASATRSPNASTCHAGG